MQQLAILDSVRAYGCGRTSPRMSQQGYRAMKRDGWAMAMSLAIATTSSKLSLAAVAASHALGGYG